MALELEDTSISGEETIQNKITSIKNMAKSYEMRLRGFKWDISNNKWIVNDKALISSDFINLSTGILTSHSENSNLLTTKTLEDFLIQYLDAFYRINVMAMTEVLNEGLPVENYRSVIKMFKDTLLNIGHIIVGSRDVVRRSFNIENEAVEQEQF